MTRPTLLLALLLASGCSDVLDFEVERSVPEQRVEGSVLSGALGDLLGAPIPLDVDIASETDARETGPASAVRLVQFSLAITDTARPEGDSDDFDFLDSVEIHIESTASGSSLPRQKVAELRPVPSGATRIELDTFSDLNLLPYAEEGARLTSTASGSVPGDDVTFDGGLTLLVEVL
jgi:hypothetical protein